MRKKILQKKKLKHTYAHKSLLSIYIYICVRMSYILEIIRSVNAT